MFKQMFFLAFLSTYYLVQTDYAGKFITVSSWIKQFDNLPKNRQGADAAKHSGFAQCGSKIKQWQEFEEVLQDWLDLQVSGLLLNNQNWLQANNGLCKPQDSFYDTQYQKIDFQPFAQKLVLQHEDQVYIRGDLHGDIFSLLAQLKDLREKGIIDDHFKLIHKNTWFAFLGDYVDRGQYGCEVLYTMMRLALANPERMIYVRGNHEDRAMQVRYGFKQEVDNKFGDEDGSKHKKICRMYDFMPVVCYIGCKDVWGITQYLQCCHGGLEIGYDPKKFLDSDKRYQLLGLLHRKACCNNLLQIHSGYVDQLESIYDVLEDNILLHNPRSNNLLGFMWNDFDVLNMQQFRLNASRGGGFVHGKIATQDILKLQSSEKSKIRGVLRAHQHATSRDDMMKGLLSSNGVYTLWNPYENQTIRSLQHGLVWTFNVGADSVYGDGAEFDFDTYAKIIVERDYVQWSLEIINMQIM